MRLQDKPINPEINPSIIQNPNWEKGQIMKNKPQDCNTMLTMALACLQALATNWATCVAASFGVWCGGDLSKRKQRKEEGGSKGNMKFLPNSF